MSPFSISWKSLRANSLTSLLNVLLIAFGIGILAVLLLASSQISSKVHDNARGIDLVVGAKGSPMQLILSSVFYIDYPTGNISLQEADSLARHPLVKRAVPLALGDNIAGARIVGTDSSFINLYNLQLAQGNFWQHDFEVTVGATVAQEQHLQPGDILYGAHGLSEGAALHEEHPYRVAGILKPKGNATDHLVLTGINSIWRMHGQEEEHDYEHGEEEEHHAAEKEITALLIQYKSPGAMVLFPRLVNKSTNMQAASPAHESARLFSLIGVGIDTLQWFALFIMLMAAISVFISLYNSLKERKYDLAVMRIMGASKSKLFQIVLLEGVLLALAGSLLGLLLGHATLQLINSYQESAHTRLSGLYFMPQELYLLAAGCCVGMVAAALPAIQAYQSDISKILSKS
ncbi:ABC transporter permease [Pontibacter qinzhouensis]|uniref:ABC transporter permease n=1 Tax=Pontibacter qinzhouensis TaxID=2603253 RepID=A0A5C8JI13_9BACT|nr:FtsX-like permease family protein [Pontibacter qinzhouensis]TXK38145.1 ABC transporter permease [Pontibacter qinzhouensis]